MNLVLGSVVLAQGITNPAVGPVGSGDGVAVFGQIISVVVSFMLAMGILMSLLYFILSTYHWINAGGDKGKLIQARDGVIQAVLGLVVLLSIFTIASLLGNLFGINLLQFAIPSLNPTGAT